MCLTYEVSSSPKKNSKEGRGDPDSSEKKKASQVRASLGQSEERSSRIRGDRMGLARWALKYSEGSRTRSREGRVTGPCCNFIIKVFIEVHLDLLMSRRWLADPPGSILVRVSLVKKISPLDSNILLSTPKD